MRGQNAATRLVLVNSADKERIGTTGSAPMIGTSTSGINAPVPYPATPPTTEAISAIPAIRTSSSKEMSVKPERTDSSITATLYQPPRLPPLASVGTSPDPGVGSDGRVLALHRS